MSSINGVLCKNCADRFFFFLLKSGFDKKFYPPCTRRETEKINNKHKPIDTYIILYRDIIGTNVDGFAHRGMRRKRKSLRRIRRRKKNVFIEVCSPPH